MTRDQTPLYPHHIILYHGYFITMIGTIVCSFLSMTDKMINGTLDYIGLSLERLNNSENADKWIKPCLGV